jgi:PAS domain S-box-containing protein
MSTLSFGRPMPGGMGAVQKVLIVSRHDLRPDLGRTVLWRGQVQRVYASHGAEALELARVLRPSLTVVDAEHAPSALMLIERLRQDPEARHTGIVVLGRPGSMDQADAFRAAGANAVLPSPVEPVLWDSRLAELLQVPPRRAARIPVMLHLWASPTAEAAGLEGLVLNISVHGMLVETVAPLAIGTRLDLNFRLPGSPAPLRVVGQVVRQAGMVDGRYRWGVKLVVLPGDAEQRIEEFVACAAWPHFEGRRPRPQPAPESQPWAAELKASEARHTAILQAALDAVVGVDLEGRIVEFNRAAEAAFGHSRAEVLGKQAVSLLLREAGGRETLRGGLAQMMAGGPLAGAGLRLELSGRRADGSEFPVEVALSAAEHEGRFYLLVMRDLTDQRVLESQCRQAQKMEAVGRLAGGIAHDFNNLLNVITGYSELLLRRLDDDSDTKLKALEIMKAAERAARLTRQLLAFSRRQVLQPQVFDLNAAVSDMKGMLGRLIGEDVALEARLDPSLGRVLADPGQFEQVLMNLAINARDAMPRGGRLTIETANVDVDERRARRHLDGRAGAFVMLRVADSGVGMDEETRRNVFEPFFTTKGLGQGTGLGLATVYGIVQQSGGWVRVESEPGQGAVFEIFLPRVDGPAAAAAATAAPPARARAAETVLLVEDEEMLRVLTCETLQAAGYQVLAAADAEEALRMEQQHPGPIHLLLTNVVMPGANGSELARCLHATRPGMKVIFASGYTDDILAHRGGPAPGGCFLQKPYTTAALENTVREVLDAPAAGRES